MDFKELKDKLSWLQKDFNARFSIIAGEIKAMEAADQARVNEAIKIPCLSYRNPLVHCMNPDCKCNKPAPVVERFVMWESKHFKTIDGFIPIQLFDRHRRGEVMATIGEKEVMVTLPDNRTVFLGHMTYDWLKSNGCFGEQCAG